MLLPRMRISEKNKILIQVSEVLSQCHRLLQSLSSIEVIDDIQIQSPSIQQSEKSPFVKHLLKKAVDEYAISSLPEFEGNKFQNVAKEGFNIDVDIDAAKFGWTANMQKIIQSQTHSKTQDMQRDYYLNQKKALEINTRHPLIKELLRRVEDNPADQTAKDMAVMMFNTATLR